MNPLLLCLALVTGAANPIKVLVDGDDVEFADAKPQMIRGKVYVPFRKVLESVGCQVVWDAKTSSMSIQRGESAIELRLNDRTALVNNEKVQLPAAPLMNKQMRVMVPLRTVAELIGTTVDWDPKTSTVNIYSTSE